MTTTPDAPEVIETPAPVETPEVEETDEELAPGEAGAPAEEETPEQLRQRLADSEEARRKLYARLQREKSKGKPAAPPAPAAPAAAAPSAPATGLSRDEAILIAQGLSVEELDKAKKIADLEGIALLDVPKNDLFTTWKEKRDKEAKTQAAQLGASRGSKGSVKKSFTTPGLSDEDHKALFKDKIGA